MMGNDMKQLTGPSHSYRGGRGKAFFEILHWLAILQVEGAMNEDEVNDTHMTGINEFDEYGIYGLCSHGLSGRSCCQPSVKTLECVPSISR